MHTSQRTFNCSVFLALLGMLCSSPAFAEIADSVCAVVDILQGPLGAGAATLAVASVGISAITGRGSWGMAMTVAVGIVILFGAAQVSDMLIGERGCP